MLIGVGVLFRISYSGVSYLYVSLSRLITSVGEERAYRLLVFLLFLFFILVLGIGCAILLWHSLCLSYTPVIILVYSGSMYILQILFD